MKTAISLPDELFRRAEEEAERLSVSRSRLYADALTEYLRKRDRKAITERLTAIYSIEPSNLDPAILRAQLAILDPEW